MANIVLILGNGFDVDLGLKSKYTDFIKGKEWQHVCDFIKDIKRRYSDGFQSISLLIHMMKASENPSLWFDVENEIHKFIKTYPAYDNKITDSLSGITKEEFIMLKNALSTYLQRMTHEFHLDVSKWSYILLKTLIESNSKVNVFTFNYTNSCALCKLPQIDINYIHGSLEDNDIILGCEIIGREYFPKSFSFLQKSNMISRPNNIIEKLMDANEVIFFGHSLNFFDYPYFEEFFVNICFPIDHDLYLTFVTRNKESELDIRDNIREQGILIQNLYKSNIKTVFIHSEPNKSEMPKEQDCFENLLHRIKEY